MNTYTEENVALPGPSTDSNVCDNVSTERNCVNHDVIVSLLEVPFLKRGEAEKRDILNKSRPIPRLSLLQREKTKTRTFNSSWYQYHKWMCGSVRMNKLFCWPCMLLGTKKSVWTCAGYSDMKNISRATEKHASSKEHLNNFLSFNELSKQAFTILELLDEHEKMSKIKFNKEVKMNREIFKKLVELTCTLCKQELSFRGHDETENSLNPGNFRALFEVMLNCNTELKEHWEKMGYFRGISKTIQNELIECIYEEINEFIDDSIKKAPFFACLVDETTDITEISQCSIFVRLVDMEGEIQEYFLGFYDIDENRSAGGMCNVLSNVLDKYNVEKKLIAQTYDGASVMAGELNGLQTLVREIAPQAIFTHCFAHRLNLVLQQSCRNISPAKIFFSTLQGIPAFFHRSPKRTSVLDRIVRKRIPTNSEVRWNSNAKIISAVLNEREKLIKVFDEIMNSSDSSAKSVRQAEGYKSKLQEFDFVIFLKIFHDIFLKTEILYSVLQKKTNDVQFCANAVSECISHFNSMRTDEKVSEYMENAAAVSRSEGTSLKLHELRSEPIGEPPASKYRQLYFQILDNITTQLKARFSNYDELKFLSLGDTSQFEKYYKNFPFYALDNLMGTYGAFFSKEKLKNELETIFSPQHKQTFHSLSLKELIKKMTENETDKIVPEAYKLFCLIATIPATSASVERSFSCLKRIKTCLRNSLGQYRLSAMACVSIEKGILSKLQKRVAWYDDVINRFATKKARRINLLYK